MAVSSTRKPGADSSGVADGKKTGYTHDPGIYLATVIGHVQDSRMGELYVTIPDWNTPGTDDVSITVGYASPFYGSTYGTDSGDPSAGNSPMTSGQSYGMWFVPPDIGNKVLVMFTAGDQTRNGYWFACVYDTPSHHMVPGLARNVGGEAKVTIPSDGIAPYLTTSSVVPVVEFSTAVANPNGDLVSTPRYPHEYQAMRLALQGLDADPIRGAISSSSLRESPSNVYGISTPGRKITAGDQVAANPELVYARKGGHTFVMDDGDAKGNDQLIRLRTTNGHQILMNDTENVLYVGSASGNQWLEFSQNGQINVYGIGGFNLRTKGPMNFHSDSSITMDALSVKIQGELSVGISAAGSLSLSTAGALSMGAGAKTSISAMGEMTIASGMSMDLGAIGKVSIDGSLLLLNSGKPPVPIPPIPSIPKLHTDTKFDGHHWVATPMAVASICKVVPSHEPWARPDATPSETAIGAPTATTPAATSAAAPTAKSVSTTAPKNTATTTTGSTPASSASVTDATKIATSTTSFPTATTINGTGSSPAGPVVGGTTGSSSSSLSGSSSPTGTTTTGISATTLVYPTLITAISINPTTGVPGNTTGFTYTFTFDKAATVAFQIAGPAIGFTPAGSTSVLVGNTLPPIPIAVGAKGFTYFVDTTNYVNPGSIRFIGQGTANAFGTMGGNGGNMLTFASGVTVPSYTVVASTTVVPAPVLSATYPSAFTVAVDKTTGTLGSATGFTYTITLNKPSISAFTVVLSSYFQPSGAAAIQLSTVSINVPAAATTFTYYFDLSKMKNNATGAAVAPRPGTIYLQNIKTGFMVVSNSDGSTSTPASNGGNDLAGVTQLPIYTLSSIPADATIVDINMNSTYQYVISRTDNASPTPHITTTTLPEVIFTTGGTSSQTVNGTTYTFVYGSGGTVTKTTSGTPSTYPKSYTITIDNTTGVAGNKTGFTISVTLNIPALTTFSGLMNVAFSGKTVGTIPVTFLAGAVTSNYKFDVTKIIPQAVGGTIQIPNGIYVDNAGNGNYNLTGPDSPIYTVTPPVVVPVVVKPTNVATVKINPATPTINQPFTVAITGGYPGDTVAITGSVASSTTLDANGSFIWNNLVWGSQSFVAVLTFAETGQVLPVSITLNPAAPVYNPVVYAVDLTTGAQTNSFNWGDQAQALIKGGQPGDSFTMSGDLQGTGVLDANGSYAFPTTVVTQNYNLVFTFGTGKIQTMNITVIPKAVATAAVYNPIVYVNDLTNGQTGLVANASFDYGDTLQVYIAGGRPGDTFNITGDISTTGILDSSGTFTFDSLVLDQNYTMIITFGTGKIQHLYIGVL